MKKGLRLLLLILLMVTAVSGTAFGASAEQVTLELDGKAIQTEVPPTIIQGRTMIPAKFLFEAMGGTVDWIAESKQVKVTLYGTTVLLSIGSKTAFVNGATEQMDVGATIINQRTFIPVAFVAQKLGCIVNWVEATRTVQISSPIPVEKTKITSVRVRDNGNTCQIIVEADGAIDTYQSYAYDSPERFILDFANTKLGIEVSGTEGNEAVGGQIVETVRYAQFEPTTVRVVADLNMKESGKISLSEDKKILYIDFEASTQPVVPPVNPGISTPGAIDLAALDIPVLDWRAQSKLIVIDPGHGGKDSGSLGYGSGKKVIQMEKDLNLPIALRINELLQAAGANTYLLRETDTAISLYERPAKANELNASLYLSVHNNSNETGAPNGTETHYFNKSTDKSYGYTSKQVAESVQQELVKEIGLANRGVKSSPSLAVLNKSQMPAIIIEGGFLSNSTELAYLMTPEFREAYAVGAARGIIKALNASVQNN